MTIKVYERRIANEICKKLKEGLSFSCKVGLIKRSILSLRRREYALITDAPDLVVKDIIHRTT